MISMHSKAPIPTDRGQYLGYIHDMGYKTFITIEPIMKFSTPKDFAELIIGSDPSFVNIGADSKRSSLIEPTWEEVQELIDRIKKADIEIRIKTNLSRLTSISPRVISSNVSSRVLSS